MFLATLRLLEDHVRKQFQTLLTNDGRLLKKLLSHKRERRKIYHDPGANEICRKIGEKHRTGHSLDDSLSMPPCTCTIFSNAYSHTPRNGRPKPVPNAGYYHNQVVKMDDTDFIMSTLWSQISPADEYFVRKGMNDFREILNFCLYLR